MRIVGTRRASSILLLVLMAMVIQGPAHAVSPLTLTLGGPSVLGVGDVGVFTGTLTLAGLPVSGEQVDLARGNGQVLATVTTDSQGVYKASLVFATTGIRWLVAVADRGEPTEARSRGRQVRVVNPFSGATAIAGGWGYTCALVAGGEARCWGDNTWGQLGDGTTTNRTAPVPVSGLSGATAIAAGDDHTCALVAGGEARCWGYNRYGQLGDGTTTSRTTPVPVSGLSGATAIAAAGAHTCALVSGGEARCWGANGSGQLGDGTQYTNRLTPVPVSGLSGATAIAAGEAHTCALVAGGEARCWGNNFYGQLGDGTQDTDRLTPVPVSGLSGATAIAAGAIHTCALVAGGEARCWGANHYGHLGDGTTTRRTTPVPVSGLSGATAIAAGTYHTCALVASGEARCWGGNFNGQLGDGTNTDRLTPVPVSGLSGATAIDAGGIHTCALVSGGEARCWGWNYFGQLGDGTRWDRTTPNTVPAP